VDQLAAQRHARLDQRKDSSTALRIAAIAGDLADATPGFP
jgi:hypothetical protein